MSMMDFLQSDYGDRRNGDEKDDLIEEQNLSPVMRKPLEMGDSPTSSDNEHLFSFLNGVEANPYLDAFYAVLSQVLDTPNQKTFFNLLQHLREIHLLRHPSGIDYVWDGLEKFACRLKVLRSPSEAQELLIRLTYECGNCVIDSGTMINSSDSLGCCCPCHRDPASTNGATPVMRPPSPPPLPPPQAPQPPPSERKRQLPNGQSADSRRPTFAELISNAASASLKSSEAPVMTRNSESTSRPPNPASLLQSPPPPPAPSHNDSVVIGVKLLPQQNLPQPKTKLKTFPWSKVPESKIVENAEKADNVWMKAASSFDTGAILNTINFDDLETLFAAQTSSPPNTMERHRGGDHSNGGLTPMTASRLSNVDYHLSSNGVDGPSTLGRRRDASSDINLLDPKRSLNVNIFLKQFRGGIDDLIELIETGDSHYLGLEKLRGLIKMLPEPDELEALKAYVGDRCKLGNAERFFLALINVSNYRLRVESMLLKEEFLSMVDYMKPSVNTLIEAAHDLKNSQSLQEVLYLLLLVGNYLNAGGYGGNAAGFKMTSLWKLVEIRANKPNVTLLHYVVAEIEKKNPRLLDLPKELKRLDDASKLAFDTIVSDFRHLKEKTERISKQVSQTDAEDEIRNQTEVFFEFAKGELITIERDIAHVDRLRLDLAAFFCEDSNTFKLEECFKIFSTFCQRFARAIDENTERRLQEEKAELRQRLREQQKAKKELAISHRESFNETDSSRRLSDKYKSLLNSGDVLLPYISPDSANLNLSNGTGNDRHTSLVDVLTTGSSSGNSGLATHQARRASVDYDSCHEADFSPGSSNWRRSYNSKRRGASSITSSTFTNRERPRELDTHYPKPWHQRFDVLLAEGERPGRAAYSASSTELDSLCHKRQNSRQDASPSPVYAVSVDKPVECSPIFAKTFPRRDTGRIASISDLDQCRTSSPLVSQDMQPKAPPPVEMKRSVWREHRRIRANSLLTDVGEGAAASANDLNELLEILKIENGSNAAVRRRVSKLKSMASESGDEIDLSPLQETTRKTDIDEMVRHCEQFQARVEIDCMGQPVSTTIASSILSTSPKSDKDSSCEECSAEFTISASEIPDCTSCNMVISHRGDVRISTADSHDSMNAVDRCSEAVSVSVMSSPSTAPNEMLDEGFEEDGSNSTNCSSVTGVQSPPLLPASPKMHSDQKQQRCQPFTAGTSTKTSSTSRPIKPSTKSVSTTASQTKFSYQSGTQSSAMKASQNPSTQISGRLSIPSSRGPSARGSMDLGPPVRSSANSNGSKLKPCPNSAKTDRTVFQSRKPVSSHSVERSTSKPEGKAIGATAMAPTKCSAAKARIQVIPPTRLSAQRQRLAASNRASSSSSNSGSDSENRGPPKHTPFRKRLPPATICKPVTKEQTPVRRAMPVKEKQDQNQLSALALAPRASVSRFRPFNVRKSSAAAVA